MAPISSNTLALSLPQLDHGVLIILAVIISILLIVIAFIPLGPGQQAVGWVINQWQHLGLHQHSSSPHPPHESMQLPIQTPPPSPTPPIIPEALASVMSHARDLDHISKIAATNSRSHDNASSSRFNGALYHFLLHYHYRATSTITPLHSLNHPLNNSL
jgi:hypothetical protein